MPQLRLLQGDTWDDPLLAPAVGSALDVRGCCTRRSLSSRSDALRQLLPPAAYTNTPATSFATKFVHVSMNKVRAAVDVVAWTPEGRRLLTGSQIGEFTLWNGAR